MFCYNKKSEYIFFRNGVQIMGKMGLMGESSNEKRNQRIMRLRNAFNDEQFNTLQEVVDFCGYTVNTVRKWAVDGNIPLLDDETGQTVVKKSPANSRHINENNRAKHIKQLNAVFNKQQAVTVQACSQKLKYPEKTIVSWAKSGDIPLICGTNQTVVPITELNMPIWL